MRLEKEIAPSQMARLEQVHDSAESCPSSEGAKQNSVVATIPATLRRNCGIGPGDNFDFVVKQDSGEVVLELVGCRV